MGRRLNTPMKSGETWKSMCDKERLLGGEKGHACGLELATLAIFFSVFYRPFRPS